MIYLLDSNVLLWVIENNKRLGKKTRQLLLDTETQDVVVSVVSLWEIYIKVSIGKLKVDIDLEEFCMKKTYQYCQYCLNT